MTPQAMLLSALSTTAPVKCADKIRRALREAGSVTAAAKQLSVSRSLLYRLMSELGVSLERVVR
jgi:transcriptional regulator of acetoin/glycerol metabolism